MKNTRRSFILMSSAELAARTALGANDGIVLALVGARNQGKGVALRSIKAGARIKTICDIDDAIYAAVGPVVEEAQGKKPEYVKDYRKVLDDKSIDAVIIAAPDHWHTHMSLAALQAGKDLFIEKPLSQTIHEGQLIRDASRKYNRVVQVGTMRRSGPHFIRAAEYVASGKLGKVALVRCWQCQVRATIGNPPDGAPPGSITTSGWGRRRNARSTGTVIHLAVLLGLRQQRTGNQGVHMIDVALMGFRNSTNGPLCRAKFQHAIYWLDDAKEVPDTQVTTFDYGNFLLVWELQSFAAHHPVEGARNGTAFYGTDATLVVDGSGWRVYDNRNKMAVSEPASPLGHEQNFLECMRTRKRPNSDVEIGRLSTTLCNLGNIVTHLKRDIVFDPKTETFGNDREANAMLTKRYRKGFELPSV
jgi:predicted dehydrogenase